MFCLFVLIFCVERVFSLFSGLSGKEITFISFGMIEIDFLHDLERSY